MPENKELRDYRILHFDDEPANIRGLREVIFDNLCNIYPGLDDTSGARRILPDNAGMVITVAQAGFLLTYLVANTEEKFDELVAAVPAPQRCVLILDLMRAGDKNLELVGNVLYKKYKQKPFVGMFFLTAYESKVYPEIVAEIGKANIWPKPPTTSAFINEVISRLSPWK